jgi:GT2 family glycosyltransferase
VDINWCWRLLLRGYTILGTARGTLVHELSSGLRETRWITLTSYGPVRRYFQCRNAVYHLLWVKMPSGGNGFMLRGILSTMISAIRADNRPWQSFWQCCRGIAHGIGRKMGPYRP